MCSTSVDPKIIRWANRTSKRSQDEPLSKLMAPYLLSKDIGDTVRMVTLPGSEWMYERALIHQHPELYWEFMGLEQDQDVYAKMRNNSATLLGLSGSLDERVLCANSTTHAFLRDSCTFYHIMYFDYMGTWSKAKEADVELIARNQACDLFACTIALNRGQPNTNEMLEDMSQIGYRHLEYIIDSTGRHSVSPHYKILGTPERILQLFETNGHPMTLLGGFVYDSPSTVHPHNVTCQMTMVFQAKETII